MFMTFRWFGPKDAVTLPNIRQVPGIEGIVAALLEIPAGAVWPKNALEALGDAIENEGFRFSVVESIPVHEDIKLGRPERDRYIDNYCSSIRTMGELGIPVLCYNFMPVFDWMRTSLDYRLPDGSSTMAYDHSALSQMQLSGGVTALPAWVGAFDGASLGPLLAAYRNVDAEQLWANLAHFVERVAPVAEASGVKLAIHPDDPPWPIFGLPRIITDAAALGRLMTLVDSPANGVTFCTGSLGALPSNDLPAMIRQLGTRVHFVHCRNVRVTADREFHETAHPSRFGSVDMLAGYGLHDRALGATYLQGMWEALGPFANRQGQT
jgi:mannonate dehydratase